MKEHEPEFSSFYVACHSNCQATLLSVDPTVIAYFKVMFGKSISSAGDPTTVE